MASKKKYYAVKRGRRPGIYTTWFGPRGAHVQVEGFAGARYKGFATRTEAEAFLRNGEAAASMRPVASPPTRKPDRERTAAPHDRLAIYTDGGALGNPGPGGWGAVILDADPPTELSGGFRRTTNNRMELTGAIMALRHLDRPMAVRLHTDSRYVVDGITKGWARRWQRQNWMRTRTAPALNADLWAALLELTDRHEVEFVWVPGHAGIAYNERCDALVRAMSARGDLPPDPGYDG